jgi:hypothetical protein
MILSIYRTLARITKAKDKSKNQKIPMKASGIPASRQYPIAVATTAPISSLLYKQASLFLSPLARLLLHPLHVREGRAGPRG